jgi:hypothetical protein
MGHTQVVEPLDTAADSHFGEKGEGERHGKFGGRGFIGDGGDRGLAFVIGFDGALRLVGGGGRWGLVTCEQGSKVLEGWTRLSIKSPHPSLFCVKNGERRLANAYTVRTPTMVVQQGDKEAE